MEDGSDPLLGATERLPVNGDLDTLRPPESGAVSDDATTGVHFFPPLYIQRYSLAVQFLMKHNITSVIDFGCSECGFMQLLPTVPSLERIALVDIDRDLLVSKKWAIKPELRHYVYCRRKPLHVKLLAGRGEDTDPRLLDYEAVTLIEVIEHLYPEVLENVADNVFGKLTPKLCVVTTPNSEFNVLFENDDPKQFRHWDHKFEWTRQEFRCWCEKICQLYGYNVEYTGVGKLSSAPESDHLGPCSQAAVFTLQRKKMSPECGQQISECYELIEESDFPYDRDIMSLEEKIDIEVSYCLRQMIVSQRDDFMFDQPVQISVSRLAQLYTVKALCDETGVRESLQRTKHRVSSDGLFVLWDNTDDSEEDLLDPPDEVEDERDRSHVVSDSLLKVGHMKQCETTCGADSQDKMCRGSPHDNGNVAEENWDTYSD